MKPFIALFIVFSTILFTPLCSAGPVAFYAADPDVEPNQTITIYLIAGAGVNVIGLGFDVIDDISPSGTASNPVLNANFNTGYDGLPSDGEVLYVMATVTSIPAVPVTGTLWSFDYQVPDVSSPTTITITTDPAGSEDPHVTVLLEDLSTESYVPDALVLNVTPPATNYTLTTSVVSGHGSLLPASGDYEEGTEVALTATPDGGYRVKQWTGADNTPAAGSTSNTVTMTTDKTVTVEFEAIPQSYTLTASVVGGNGSVSPTSGSYEEGTQVALMATPNPGYRVKEWIGAEHTPAFGVTSNTVTMTSDKTVTVEFEAIPVTYYNLSAEVIGGHGSISPTSGTYAEDTEVDLTATPDSGYQVKEWIGADNTPSAGNDTNTVTMTDDKTVTVEFEIIPTTYTLTAQVVSGHGSVSPTSGSYDEGTKVTLTATPDTGYQVKAWTGADVTPAAGNNTNTATMNSDKTVTVEFELIPSVSYDLTTQVVGNHGTVSPSSGSYDEGTQVTLTATPETGYQVKAWTGTDFTPAAGNNSNTVTMTGDKTVTVEFELIPANSYTLTAQVIGGNGTIIPESGTYENGTQVTLTATPNSGYQLKSWSGTDNDVSLESSNTVTMTGDKTVTVEFELIPPTMYLLTTQVDGGHGTISPQSTSYQEGTEVTLTATLDNGYQVKAWTGTNDDSSVDITNTVTMNQDRTVTVEFASSLLPNKCLVKAGKKENSDSLQLSGKFLADSSDIENADSISLQIRSDSGFSFTADPIPFDNADLSNGKFRYTRRVPVGQIGGVTFFMFDLNRQAFSLKLDKISLTGLASPIIIEMEIGDYTGIAVITENLINGQNKDIPITLMKSYANELRVSRARYKQSLKAGRDSLLVNGEIAVENTAVDLTQTDIEIGWGDYSILLPAGKMFKRPNKNVFVYAKEKGDPVSKAIFDLDRCRFNILIRNTTIPPQTSPAEFRITFNGFDETVLVE